MPGYQCASCGTHHDELPLCFISPEPALVVELTAAERKQRVQMSSDQCVLDEEHFFVLGNLDIPIVGHAQFLRFTVWSSLSQKSFLRACELWNTPGREQGEPAYFGWLCSVLPSYSDTQHLKLDVLTSPVGVRPCLKLHDEDHDLCRDQAQGISWERAVQISNAAMGR